MTVIPEPDVDPEVLTERINQEAPKVKAKSPRQFVGEDGTIIREYLTEAGLMGIAGGVAGIWFGWVVATVLNTTVVQALNQLKAKPKPEDVAAAQLALDQAKLNQLHTGPTSADREAVKIAVKDSAPDLRWGQTARVEFAPKA